MREKLILPARRSLATDQVREKTTRALLPKMVTRVLIRGTREGLPAFQHSPGRDPATPRDHSAPLVRNTIPGSAGRRPEYVLIVGRQDIKCGIARNRRIPAGSDPSLQFRDPGLQQLLRAEIEALLRQRALHQGEPDRRQDSHRADRPESMHSPARRQRLG